MIFLAIWDLSFLVIAICFFALPELSRDYFNNFYLLMVPYGLPIGQILLTGSIYSTLALTVERWVHFKFEVNNVYHIGHLSIHTTLIGSEDWEGREHFFQKSCSKYLCGCFPPIKSLKIVSKYLKGEMWLFSSEGMFLFGYNIKSNNKIYNIQNIRIAKIDRKMKLNFMLF